MTDNEDNHKYMYQLVTPSKEVYIRLVEIHDTYPELTYVSKGYDGLSKEIVEAHKDVIDELNSILRKSLLRFRRFQNFTPRVEGNWDIRLQYGYDRSFTGVGYFDVRHWNPEDHGKY